MSKTQKENDLQTKERVKRPQRYKVIMSNDDFTPMEFVIGVLEHFFNRTPAQSTRIMLTIHHQGYGVAGVYSKEVAETKRDKTIQFARENGYPLMLHTEPE
jgi:ATP-dependent Clp protease adaptor protein ClpS